MANGMTFRVHRAAMWSIVLSVLILVAEAIYLFDEGVLEFTLWFQLRTTPGKAWLLLDGIVTLILAAMIWRTWPSSAAWMRATIPSNSSHGFSRCRAKLKPQCEFDLPFLQCHRPLRSM